MYNVVVISFLLLFGNVITLFFPLHKNGQILYGNNILRQTENVLCENRIIKIDNAESLNLQMIYPNTIYEIGNVIDLKNRTINIPSNSILYLKGGILKNGRIIGNKCRIVAPFGMAFSNISFNGTFYADKIRMSWWGTLGVDDNTKEVQDALNAISSFKNRIFVFDIPVRITDVSFVLKWAQGTKFEGVGNSIQGDTGIIVFGKNSLGLDISGTENLQFENLLFRGDEKNPPKTLLFASRLEQNKQCKGHIFKEVTFCGNVTKSLIYNYAGELWNFDNCKFRISRVANCDALYYATSMNSLKEKTKFAKTENRISMLTCLNFVKCNFSNLTSAPSIFLEGGQNRKEKLCNMASICFDKCYFYTPKGSTAIISNVSGSVSIVNCIDESGADSNSNGIFPLYHFVGDVVLNGLTFCNNTIYARKKACIIDAQCAINNYNSFSNYVINASSKWRFTELNNACHWGLSNIETFEVTDKYYNVKVETMDKEYKNVILR